MSKRRTYNPPPGYKVPDDLDLEEEFEKLRLSELPEAPITPLLPDAPTHPIVLKPRVKLTKEQENTRAILEEMERQRRLENSLREIRRRTERKGGKIQKRNRTKRNRKTKTKKNRA
jgi:hypothetical protein